jgi:TolA-binding protein
MCGSARHSRGWSFRIVAAILLFFILCGAIPQAYSDGPAADPNALYERGVAERDLGFKALEKADDKARAVARKHFEKAASHFAAAAQGNKPPAGDLEWSACARCARAEMELHAGKFAEARAAVAPFLTDPALARSRYRDLALYELGLASLLLGDHLAAGRSLSLITSFTDPQFCTHARYLLGRVHERSEERREAVLDYQAVLAGYEELKKAAADQQAAIPAHVSLANLRLAVLHYGDGRFEDARSCFAEFLAQQPQSPLLRQAQVGLGASLVQLNQSAEAVPVLREVAGQKGPPAGRALLWLGRAQLALSRGDDPNASAQALQDALTSFRRLADDADAEAKSMRDTALMDLAEALQSAGRDLEAAPLFARITAERLLPGRDEELLQRQITALSRAGDYDQSDALCRPFLRNHPHGVAAAEVLFRHAENAYFRPSGSRKGSAFSGPRPRGAATQRGGPAALPGRGRALPGV